MASVQLALDGASPSGTITTQYGSGNVMGQATSAGSARCADCGAPVAPDDRFCRSCGRPVSASLEHTPQHLTERILAQRGDLIGERKQVTVLYADIHDMQVLLGALDPEVVQQLLEPALHTMLDAVQRYGGTAPQVADDGVMALFGAPVAYEDHAVRACHAALAMQAALRTYADDVRRTHDLPLQCRMGLNAGEVVMRAVHHAPHREYSLIGQTTYLAERLMQVALPDTILLTAFTARLVAGLVGVKALPPLPVPGFAEPVEVYALLETSGQTGVRDRGSAIWHIRTCQAR